MTQIIGWGTTFYLPAVLVRPISTDLGLSEVMVFGGITIMLLVNALFGPLLGSLIDRHGARRFLMSGSVLMTCGLVALAGATGATTYAVAWGLIGVASVLALSQAALPALSQIAGEGARRAIGTTMLFSALSSSIFWPLTAWLELQIGWRTTCIVFAAFHLLICLPLHTALHTENKGTSGNPNSDSSPPIQGTPTRRKHFALAAVALSAGGFVAWGLPVHVIELMKSVGHSTTFAISLGSLMGIAQVAARAAEMLFGYRFGILGVGVASISFMAVALLLPIVGGSIPAVALAFAIGFGLGIGSFTIVRVVVPLHLFGPAEYAAMMGRLGVPQNVVFAFSPIAFAQLFHDAGAYFALGVAFSMALLALGAMAALAQSARNFSHPNDIA